MEEKEGDFETFFVGVPYEEFLESFFFEKDEKLNLGDNWNVENVRGTVCMFKFLYEQSEIYAKKIAKNIEKYEKDVKKEYENSKDIKSIVPEKIYIDSNLFNILEKEIVSEIKENFEFVVENLNKGWPIIEYASDVFQSIPGDIPTDKKIVEKNSLNFFKMGYEYLKMGINLVGGEKERFLKCVAKNACYCGRVKFITDEFPNFFEKLLIQNCK